MTEEEKQYCIKVAQRLSAHGVGNLFVLDDLEFAKQNAAWLDDYESWGSVLEVLDFDSTETVTLVGNNRVWTQGHGANPEPANSVNWSKEGF